MLISPGVASAATYHVTGKSDSPPASCSGSSCPSLRSAVIASNATAGPNTIDVPAGTYKLTRLPSGSDDATTGDLNITTDVTIIGAGAKSGGTTIVGDKDRIFDITAQTVTFSGLAMTGGSVPSSASSIDGGAIHDEGSSASLTLTHVLLSGNKTASGGFGGAVDMEPSGSGTLKVTNGVFRSNTAAQSGAAGGGFGGAIMFQPELAGTMTVTNSEFDSNTAQTGTRSGGGFGGAISFESGDVGTLTIKGSTFNSNKAEGSIGSGQGGFGGAISFEPGNSPSTLSATNSTFTANSAGGDSSFGGGIDFEPGSGSSGTLTHVTMSGNSASTANQGGGIWVQDAPMTVRNSIISGNTGGGSANNCQTSGPGAAVVPQGHNIEVGKSCGFDINANPLLAALAHNGGPTQTMAIPANSPAHDAADPKFCPATDQRGVKRPDDAGTPCDIGAFEFTKPAPPPKKHHHHHHKKHHHHHVPPPPPPPKKHHHHHHARRPHKPHRGFTG